jgi:tetratricopeptide (TPR) repeat protein
LEGGIQSAGEQIRINVQLIDARTDEHLWAQTYDRELSPSNIFEVQTDIARAITSAMQATLTAQEVTQLTVIPTENMAAYRAYRRAMEARDSTEVFDTIAFRLALEEAVALDPTFTRAWAELAGVLSFENLVVVNPELLQQAEQALEQIKTLAPKSADYLIAQTYYTYYILKNYDRAYQMIKQAQVMRPSDARILELRSWIERRLGDFEGKIESTRQARILDPRNLKWTRNITRDLMMAHHYDEASAEIKDSGFQDYTLSYWNSVLQLKEHRDFARWAEAVAAIQREFSNVEDPYKLWEARIANKDYQAAKDLVHVMQEEWVDGAKAGGVLSSKIRSQIVTYWFLQLNNRLAEVLIEARANLEEGLDTDDDFSRPDAILDMALVTAAEGNTEESERLIRSWERRSAEDFAEMAFSQHRSCRVLGMAGSTAPAIECIRRGLEEPSFVMPFLEPYLPYYDSMRDEPEFIDLLAGLGDAESSP